MKRSTLTGWIIMAVISLAVVACGGTSSTQSGSLPLARFGTNSASSPIEHVVLIIQENRSFDNLFATFPGANGATKGEMKVKQGSKWVDKWQPLAAKPLVLDTDIAHCHSDFETARDGGKMDGFDLETLGICGDLHTAGPIPYQYVEESQIQPYWDIAEQWVLADDLFQSQGSGSFTAHQDLIRGGVCIQKCSKPTSSTESLVDTPGGFPWGCDAYSGVRTSLINIKGQVKKAAGPFPCSNRFPIYGSGGYSTLRDLLDAADLTWKYYTPCFTTAQSGCTHPSSNCPDCAGGTLNAFDVIYPVRYGSEWGTNVTWPDTNIFADISSGNLPAVSWVIPEDSEDDHPGEKTDDGPSWVASVVNAVGQSAYWDSSVIIVVWDDWGGLYDHVAPQQFKGVQGGLGFRVPMLVLSPYAIAGTGSKGGYVSHTQYEFGSIIKYIEENWNLPTLQTTDGRATSIGDVFNYSQSARAFTKISSKYDARYFIDRPHPIQHGDPE